MLKLRNVNYRYGEHSIFHSYDLTIHAGERVAVMGTSGSGKTTLLRLVMGLLSPMGGSVENTFQTMGVVFQEPRLLPWRTAIENVNLVLGDRSDTLETARRYLKKMELGEAADKYPREMSGGMQQRLALARALAVQGDFLILDEPFKGLDEELRQRVLEQVNEFEGAILLVTHEEMEAKALGCRMESI